MDSLLHIFMDTKICFSAELSGLSIWVFPFSPINKSPFPLHLKEAPASLFGLSELAAPLFLFRGHG